MLKIGKFDILKVSQRIEAKSIKLGSDTDLYITPKEKFIVISKEASFDISQKFFSFVPLTDGNRYGFGVRIDNEQVQIGYGTKQQFDNHAIQNGITITKDGAIIPSADVVPIPVDTVRNMVNTIFA